MSGCGPDCRQGGIRGVRLAESSCRVAAGCEAAAGERDPAASRLPWARRALLGLLAIYKLGISPLLPPACRFYPTCSQYCREAVERHGIARGLWLGLRRLCRCHPLSKGGLDPVP